MLQGVTQADSASVLRTFTDGNRSYSFQTPLQMQRFLGAALTHCKLYPNDVAYVLRSLGSQDTAGLQRLREICCFPHTNTVSCCYWLPQLILLHNLMRNAIADYAGRHKQDFMLLPAGNLHHATPHHLASLCQFALDTMLQPHTGSCGRHSGHDSCLREHFGFVSA